MSWDVVTRTCLLCLTVWVGYFISRHPTTALPLKIETRPTKFLQKSKAHFFGQCATTCVHQPKKYYAMCFRRVVSSKFTALLLFAHKKRSCLVERARAREGIRVKGTFPSGRTRDTSKVPEPRFSSPSCDRAFARWSKLKSWCDCHTLTRSDLS